MTREPARAQETAPVRRSRAAPRVPEGVLLGAHMSVAGGLHRAVEHAFVAGATALQVFTRNNTQWAAKPLADDEVSAFLAARRRHGIEHVVAHSSYLVNLASPVEALWERSIAAFRDELLRCEALGISHAIFHPGAHMGAGEEFAIDRVAAALDRIHRDTRGLKVKSTLEITAGQGTCIGHRFEHLGAILGRLKEPERAAVCLDTCHLYAAGYDIATDAGFAETMDALERHVGVERVEAFHLNDAKKGLGCRVDRHEHVGRGTLGLDAFRRVLREPRLAGRPMVIETPKLPDPVKADCANLRRLVSLLG